MANSKYNEGRAATANSDVDYDTDTFTLVALEGYTATEFDEDHDYTDITGIGTVVDTATLASTVVNANGSMTSDPVVFTGLATGDDPTCFILRDTTAGVVIGFIDTLADETLIEGTIIGDGTNVTINPPAEGWIRV